MTTQSALEQALQLYGDELYQTALLLTLDPDRAGQVMVRGVRTLAARPTPTYDELTLIAAVVAALPAKPATPARLPWNDSQHHTLISAISHLPTEQRLALDLILRRDYEPEQLAPLFGGDAARALELLRDAVIALAPSIDLALTPALLLGDDATPESCRQTRRMLVHARAAAFDPVVRSHLALCSGCRAADQGWERVRIAAESALRASLRAVTLPPLVANRVDAALQPPRRNALISQLSRPRLLQIGLPLIVLLIVGLLVLPHSAPATRPLATGASGQQPSALVQQALRTLYAPTSGEGVWHGQYEIRWNFSSGLYATLIGDIWSTAQPQQSRAQLVHIAGGAPYEFALANSQYFWYASTPIYRATVFGPLLAGGYPDQVRMAADRAQQQALFQARLNSGAWGVAAAYLRQAATARELRTWGQQRLADGSQATVIGFVGYSPLGVVADAPDAARTPITILLTISSESGRLQQVREVSGPAGGEQIGQTTWRIRDEAHVTDLEQTATLFNVDRAYNGIGAFTPVNDQRGIADPVLPNVPASAVRSPADNINFATGPVYLPTRLPTGIAHAVTIAPSAFEAGTTVYSGPGRMMLVRTRQEQIDDNLFPDLENEHRENVSNAGASILLVPGSGQRYGMQVSTGDGYTTQIFATGVSHAELLDLAASLKQFDVEDFKRDIHLFRTPQPQDPAAFDALIAALDTAPLAAGQARHVAATTFVRQGPLVDPLRDPYHQPYYAERTPTMTSELWTQRLASGQLETMSAERTATGVLTSQSITTANHYQAFDRAASFVYSATVDTDTTREPIYEPTWTVLNLLGCGGTTFEKRTDGTRIVTQRDADWYAESCNRPSYANVLYAQLRAGDQVPNRPPPHRSPGDYQGYFAPDQGPYILDVADQPLAHRVFIDPAGQAYRYEVRAGEHADGILLESVERNRDERLDAAQVPANIFSFAPPDALVTADLDWRSTANTQNSGTVSEISLTDVITRMATPLWYLPPDAATTLQHVQAVMHPNGSGGGSDIFDGALYQGFATRLIYDAPAGDSNGMSQYLYVGGAARFGAFLRTQRAWQSSRPLAVQFDGRSVDGWVVTTDERRTWTILNIDGTLVALETSSDQRLARLAQLRRYTP